MEAAETTRRPIRSGFRVLPTIFTVLAVMILATSLPAQWLAAHGTSADLRTAVIAGEHLLVLPDGGRTALPLSKVAKVGDFRALGDRWLLAAADRRDEGSTLVLLEGRDDVFSPLPVPRTTAKAVREPKLLVHGDRLGAMIWFEGDADDRLALRASRRDGDGWTTPVTVSPTGPGTQIALTTTVLADGSWLVAWAAFDGTDDEILWSRWSPDKTDGGWTQPQPVAEGNAVPDVTPALTTTSDGALLAWSRYDGRDYRVNVVRFDGEGWSEPSIVGTKGSMFPVFTDKPSPVLVYRQAQPDAWRVAELDANGKVLRQAEAEALERQTPIVAEFGDEGVLLEWSESSTMVNWLE